MATLERAIAIAAQAHAGEQDKGGAPYILHPLRVMFAMSTDVERIVAVLHDVVEDTDWTIDRLRAEGFASDILAAIDSVTCRKGESYEDFVRRAATDPIGRVVKRADLEDNLDPTRLAEVTDADRDRMAKYERALKVLGPRRRAAKRAREPLLLPISNVMTRSTIERAVPVGRPLAVDFYVEGAEHGHPLAWGFELGRIENVDHHAPVRDMCRQVSAANLVLDRLRQRARDDEDETVVLNHTDCDSVLSAGFLLGDLPPTDRLARSAIAADHTGEPDDVADLLQAIQDARDYSLSLRSLRRLLDGVPLEAEVQARLVERLRKRDVADRAVARFESVGPVAFSRFTEEIDGEFFPALLDAMVIVTGHEAPQGSGRWLVKVRLGRGAPEGASLYDLGLTEWDPRYGGRWNAGSTKRGGGSRFDPESYAKRIAEALHASPWPGSTPGSPLGAAPPR